MRLVWHGHSCFEADDGVVRIVIDPHDGRSLGIRPPSASADAVLITHSQNCHCSPDTIGGDHEDHIERCGPFECSGRRVDGYPAHHDNGGRNFGNNVMYRFTMDGISLCHCGDLGMVPLDRIVDSVRGVDLLMVPAGEVNTLPLKELFDFIDAVGPKVVIPMHYHVCGLSLPLKNLDRFLRMADGPVDHVGGEIDITKEELPSGREYWIFSR